MPALDLALGLRVIRSAPGMSYAIFLQILGQLTRDIAGAVVAQQPGFVPDLDLSFLQVSYMDKTGKIDSIHRYLSLLSVIATNEPQVRARSGRS